jgi:hypothetical protein
MTIHRSSLDDMAAAMALDSSDGPVGDDNGYPLPSYFSAYHDGNDDFPHDTDECDTCFDHAAVARSREF